MRRRRGEPGRLVGSSDCVRLGLTSESAHHQFVHPDRRAGAGVAEQFGMLCVERFSEACHVGIAPHRCRQVHRNGERLRRVAHFRQEQRVDGFNLAAGCLRLHPAQAGACQVLEGSDHRTRIQRHAGDAANAIMHQVGGQAPEGAEHR